ncbi:hypothetical protein F8O04_13000 [Pseudoclavibacter endophyticus]|uniref:Uncharacterized protein n=1 Tax=Pseudoclavibacter endophyticus TaxID=1778590 RepID=A0A6H9WA40_9MICO|nr:hypothetical protein F8O04_13000 [Pseudoclavibacter endophyticus]
MDARALGTGDDRRRGPAEDRLRRHHEVCGGVGAELDPWLGELAYPPLHADVADEGREPKQLGGRERRHGPRPLPDATRVDAEHGGKAVGSDALVRGALGPEYLDAEHRGSGDGRVGGAPVREVDAGLGRADGLMQREGCVGVQERGVVDECLHVRHGVRSPPGAAGRSCPMERQPDTRRA